MRKFIRYKIAGLAIIMAIGIVACDTASQETEPVVSPDGYPVATFTPSVTTVIEGDTITYTISIDKPIDRSITFTLKQTGGTADAEDYTVAPAVLQPYTKSVEMLVITIEDFDAEASETIVGEIGAYSISDKYLLNPSTVNPTPVNLTITNFVSPDLGVAFYWNADVVISGDTYDAADWIDFDFLVSTEAEFDIADPWASEIGIYEAVTGGYPEALTLSGLDDGSYILWADLYYNEFFGYSDGSVKIPIVAKFTRQGTTVIDAEVGMDPEEMMPDNTPGYDNVPSGVYNAVIAKVTVAGDKYTITKYDDTTIGPFKSGKAKTPRPLNYKTK